MDRRSSDEPDHDRDGEGADASAPEGGDGADQPAEPAAGDTADEPDEAAQLQSLVEDLRVAERRIATAVLKASELAAIGVAERVTGQPLSFALGVACRLTGADRATLLAAGDVLDDMPTLRAWFAEGHVSWGEVRGITQALAKRGKADRHTVDARLAATFPTDGTPACMEPDELVDAARAAVADCRDAADAARDDAEAIADSFLSIQRDFHGGARVYGEWDPVTAAGILTTLDAASPTPTRHDTDSNADADADGDIDENGEGEGSAGRSGWSPPPRSRDYATSLSRVCAEWLAATTATGDPTIPATGRRARPLLTATVDLATATAAVAGTVNLPCRGPVPRLTAAAVEALVCDAEVRAVVSDGARPLATTAKITASDIPAATRRAVEARDGGCRWAGCQAPLAHTDIHHLIPREHGGSHHPENLACLCRADHVRAHSHNWTLELDGDTGLLTGYRRNRRRWTTSPRATPLAQPPETTDGDRPPAQRDPPNPTNAEPNEPGRPGEPPDQPPPGWDRLTDNDGNPLPF